MTPPVAPHKEECSFTDTSTTMHHECQHSNPRSMLLTEREVATLPLWHKQAPCRCRQPCFWQGLEGPPGCKQTTNYTTIKVLYLAGDQTWSITMYYPCDVLQYYATTNAMPRQTQQSDTSDHKLLQISRSAGFRGCLCATRQPTTEGLPVCNHWLPGRQQAAQSTDFSVRQSDT